MTTINRKYEHKTAGLIGSVTLTAPDGQWTLNGEPLPDNAVERILQHGMQIPMDAYAGVVEKAAESFGYGWDDLTIAEKNEVIHDTAVELFNDSVDGLISGEFGSRGGRTVNPIRQLAISKAVNTIRGNPTKYGFLRVWSKNDMADVRKRAIKLVETNPAYLHLAKRDVAELAELDAKTEIEIEPPTDDDETEESIDETIAA